MFNICFRVFEDIPDLIHTSVTPHVSLGTDRVAEIHL